MLEAKFASINAVLALYVVCRNVFLKAHAKDTSTEKDWRQLISSNKLKERTLCFVKQNSAAQKIDDLIFYDFSLDIAWINR